MYRVTKSFEFDAAHRLPDHQGKCCQIHGHRYRVEVTFSALNLNSQNMVIDFGEVKAKFKKYLDSVWDHTLILRKDDPLDTYLWQGKDDFKDSMQKIQITTMSGQPTAEAMANKFYRWLRVNFSETVERVRVYETPNSWAEYVPD